MEKKKLVLKLEAHDEKAWRKAMKAVTSLPGIESLAKEEKDRKLTVVGDVDPVVVVGKLRKLFHTEVVTIGPAKEPEKKKDEPKKEEPKKDDAKKEDPKKAQEKQIEELVKAYKAYNPYLTQYYHVYSAEENPNSCAVL